MNKKEKIIQIIKKYYKKGTFEPKTIKELSNRQIKNAVNTFAIGCNQQDILIMVDTTLLQSGKKGFIFTQNEIYSDLFSIKKKSDKKLIYSDLDLVELTDHKHMIMHTKKNLTLPVDFLDIYTPFIYEILRDIIEMNNNAYLDYKTRCKELNKKVGPSRVDLAVLHVNIIGRELEDETLFNAMEKVLVNRGQAISTYEISVDVKDTNIPLTIKHLEFETDKHYFDLSYIHTSDSTVDINYTEIEDSTFDLAILVVSTAYDGFVYNNKQLRNSINAGVKHIIAFGELDRDLVWNEDKIKYYELKLSWELSNLEQYITSIVCGCSINVLKYEYSKWIKSIERLIEMMDTCIDDPSKDNKK